MVPKKHATNADVLPCSSCHKQFSRSCLKQFLSQKEYGISGMCPNCQDETFNSIVCENCNFVETLFSERVEHDPDVFACKQCGDKVSKPGSPEGRVHVTNRCHNCDERVVVFFDEFFNGTIHWGPPKCKSGDFHLF